MSKTNSLYKVRTLRTVEPVSEGCYQARFDGWKGDVQTVLSCDIQCSFTILQGKYAGRKVFADYDDELVIYLDKGKCSDFYWFVCELLKRQLKDGELIDLDSLIGAECTVRVWAYGKATVVTVVDRKEVSNDRQ